MAEGKRNNISTCIMRTYSSVLFRRIAVETKNLIVWWVVLSYNFIYYLTTPTKNFSFFTAIVVYVIYSQKIWMRFTTTKTLSSIIFNHFKSFIPSSSRKVTSIIDVFTCSTLVMTHSFIRRSPIIISQFNSTFTADQRNLFR